MIELNEIRKEIAEIFLAEAVDILQAIEKSMLLIEKEPANEKEFNSLLRHVHSFKGCSKSVGFKQLSEFSHHIETFLGEMKKGTKQLNSENVSLIFKCIDALKNDIKFLEEDHTAFIEHFDLLKLLGLEAPEIQKLAQNFSDTLSESEKFSKGLSEEFIKIRLKKFDELVFLIEQQNRVFENLNLLSQNFAKNKRRILKGIEILKRKNQETQVYCKSLKLTDFEQVFALLERTIRDCSVDLSKNLLFFGEGKEIEVERRIVDKLRDPLIHLVRNAVDHGIEGEAERKSYGKDSMGKLTLKIAKNGPHLLIRIEDDGRGLDVEKIHLKALEKGLIAQETQIEKSDLLDLVFANGFSTKDKVGKYSGRGIGLDVVKQAILALNGKIRVSSELKKGSVFEMFIPLNENGLIELEGQKSA